MKAPLPAPIERVPALDGIRGSAALMIVAWHYGPSIVRAEPGSFEAYTCKALGLAWTGVDLFFVLSGYLIMRILMEKRESPHYFRTFYLRRFWRIAPLFLLVFIVYVAVCALTGLSNQDPWLWLLQPRFSSLSYLVFTQNFSMGAADHFGPNWLSATWSLAVEEQFYLLLPMIVRFLPGRGPWVAAISGLALGPACRLLVGGGMASYTLLPCRSDALMSGAVVALALESRSIRCWIARDRIFIPTLLASAAVGGVVLIKQGASFQRIFGVPGTLLLSCVDLAGALMLAWVVARPVGRIARFFSWGPLTAAGLCSYGLYLVHEPVLGLAHGWLLRSAPVLRTGAQAFVTLAAAVASVGVAIILYNALERPCMRYARKFRY